MFSWKTWITGNLTLLVLAASITAGPVAYFAEKSRSEARSLEGLELCGGTALAAHIPLLQAEQGPDTFFSLSVSYPPLASRSGSSEPLGQKVSLTRYAPAITRAFSIFLIRGPPAHS